MPDAPQFPRGRLTADDEGGTLMAVYVKEDCVLLRFPEPTVWVAFPAEQAEVLAKTLLEKAAQARKNRQ